MIGQSLCQECQKECAPGRKTCGPDCLKIYMRKLRERKIDEKFKSDLEAAKRDGLVS